MYVRTGTGENTRGFVLDTVGAHDVDALAARLFRHPKAAVLGEAIAAHALEDDLEINEAMETSEVFKRVVDLFVEQFCMEGIEHEVVSSLKQALGPHVETAMDRANAQTPGI